MTVGANLRAARDEAGIPIEDLSRATRIRAQLLRQIESDEFGACGGAVYARGHIRSIATHLGLDPAPFLADFEREHGVESGPRAREIFERPVVAKPERTGPNWTAAMTVAAAVLLVVALISVFNSKPAPTGERLANPTVESPSPSAAPSIAPPGPEPSVDPLAGLVKAGGVFVRVRIVNSRSWVAAVADGKQVFGRTLAAGAVVDFQATRLIRLTLGNAGAVQLIVNGRDLGTPGGPGAVIRAEFGPGDPEGAIAG